MKRQCARSVVFIEMEYNDELDRLISALRW